MILLLVILISLSELCMGVFSPDLSDYDAYGLKIAANDIMLVEAQGDQGDQNQFLVQYAPYNYTSRLQCGVPYNDSSHYIYSVGIGAKQNSSQNYFFYAGDITSADGSDSLGNNGSFIGIVINKDSQNLQTEADEQYYIECGLFDFEPPYFFSSYDHPEFFVFGVEPYGQYAIGLTEYFVFIYRPFSNNSVTTKNSSSVWPSSVTFVPLAADTGISYTIVAGFVMNTSDPFASAIPSVYIISNSDLTILAHWSYTAPQNSWQSQQSYVNIDIEWSNQYTMSVDINSMNDSEVLVGMPFLNTVFIFLVSHNGSNLVLILSSLKDSGQANGFGKSVGWLSSSEIAILYPCYSLDYNTRYSTQINMYTLLNNATFPSSVSVVFPNVFQQLPSTISSQLIRMISTPSSLSILDVSGKILLLQSEPPGFYASTNATNYPYDDSMPFVSYPVNCPAGTYKSDSSIQPCVLCPNGSRNPGITPLAQCLNCSSESFCPSGAIVETDKSVLLRQSQAYAYPRSPDIVSYDDILLLNVFSIGSTRRCIVISPIFWVIVTIGLVLIVLSIMSISKWCIRNPRSTRFHDTFERIFQRTDLIGEGELWVGGLVSYAIVVLLIFVYVFSAAFYQQYPIENVGPSSFACNETLRNAQFESSLQSLSVPVSDEEQPMFDLLNNQGFNMNLKFVNTNATCDLLFIDQIFGSSTERLTKYNCVNSSGILSATLDLRSYQALAVIWTLTGIQLIGAVSVGLSGSGNESEEHTLRELNFSKTFYDTNGGTLAQSVTINLELTKAINETEPLLNGKVKFSGIWYPTFVVDQYQMFISPTQYLTSNISSTTITIIVSETSYYIQNRQFPITKQTEMIFHDLLFTMLVLEMFGLIFLIFKLAVFPLAKMIIRCFHKKEADVPPAETKEIVHQAKPTVGDLDDTDLYF